MYNFPITSVIPIKFNKKNDILALFTKFVSLRFADRNVYGKSGHPSILNILVRQFSLYWIESVEDSR